MHLLCIWPLIVSETQRIIANLNSIYKPPKIAGTLTLEHVNTQTFHHYMHCP